MDGASTDADYLFPMTFTTADGKKIIVKQAGDVLHVEEVGVAHPVLGSVLFTF
jgi:hypothetical protein